MNHALRSPALIRSGPVLLMGLLTFGLPFGAQARPGYANLINSYCQAQGAARLRYTDDGCTLCHHQGTFTTDPDHRLEPQWSEFELGRSSGNYSFFCPGSGSPPLTADSGAADQAGDQGTAPGEAAPQPAMPWMALGYPSGHAATMAVSGAPGETAPSAVAKPSAPKAVPAESLAPPTPDAKTAADLKSKLSKLHADLAIGKAQESAWQDLADAVLALGPAATAEPAAAAPVTAQLQEQQRRLAQRAAQLRAVNTALVRLNAKLNERQQRLLAARLPALIGQA
ncbi:MAG: hypothetical protein ISP90_00155 [Nevskia sp.]|nr:hypothetical protein [Nevskia sp.]